jgi:hypothetical protein
MGWDWGPWVNLCRYADTHGNFCRYCLWVNRMWHKHVLRRNPTFIGFQL